MSTISKVGILGLGKMGAPMARHLLAKGFNVHGFDPVDAARAAAARLGVAVAASPADVARASELVIIVVGFDHEVETVVYTASIAGLGRPEPGAVADETHDYEAWDLDFAYSRSKYFSKRIAEDFAVHYPVWCAAGGLGDGFERDVEREAR